MSDVTRSSIEHRYISTACLHSLHDRCRLNCKFCQNGCLCPCHETDLDKDANG